MQEEKMGTSLILDFKTKLQNKTKYIKNASLFPILPS